MNTNHNSSIRHLLERPIANGGPMAPQQMRAMWAKRNNPTPAGGQKPPRPWGETRPGELYVQVEGPGNPAWEKRHPERAPAIGAPAATPPPARTILPVTPPTPKQLPSSPHWLSTPTKKWPRTVTNRASAALDFLQSQGARP